MNIGIILFSRSGNTLLVAEKIRDTCLAQGHAAVIERVHAENEDPNCNQSIRLKEAPNPVGYDAVIFGAPVQAFSLSPIMAAYLEQMQEIPGKKVGCFVTHLLSKSWLGGNQAVSKMSRLCQSKGANVVGTGIVSWTNKACDEQIIRVASNLGRIL